MQNVTAIIVSYNTRDLLRACYESLRRYYPWMHCVIVDGSDRHNPCYEYARTRSPKINTIIQPGRNLGHGPGMVLGIAAVKTEYFLLIDSDVVIDKPGVVEAMVAVQDGSQYGVGQVIKVDNKGMNVADENGIDYLHPHFALINSALYQMHDPIINHGAPMLKAMISARELPWFGMVNFPVSDYITHKERGTRALKPRAFHPKYFDTI